MMRDLAQANLLVISDLHLGEDVRSEKGHPTRDRVLRLERELEAFLSHYTSVRRDERPWRLVINGDMLDFMSVMILPPESDAGGGGATFDERHFGLAHDERRTVEKLDHVMERHPAVFARMAGFVAAGNDLVIVMGNHDVEFHYPAVQARFVEWLVRLDGGVDAGRVSFRPWFYYEPSFVFVEHGHRYDRNCSFDEQLHPLEDSGHVQLSLAHTGMRYFTNRVPSFDPAVGEHWGFGDYVKWTRAQGWKGAAAICGLYGHMVWKAIGAHARVRGRAMNHRRRDEQLGLLAARTESGGIPLEKLRALDELRVAPALRRLAHIMSTFCLDRISLWLVATVAVLVSLALLDAWGRTFALASASVMVLALDGLFARGRVFDSDAVLRSRPAAIARILDAPIIVFGHSHQAEEMEVAGGSRYFNTGTWADNDVARAFTHLIILRDDKPHAALCQWRDGQSVPYFAPERAAHAIKAVPGKALAGYAPTV